MAIRRRSADDIRPDAWAKRLSVALMGEADEEIRARAGPLVLVVGGGWFGQRLADSLAATHSVHHVDTDPNVIRTAGTYEASHGASLTSQDVLEATGVADDDVAVVATGRDGRNLLVIQQLRTRFDLERILVVLEDPRNHDAFELPGVEAVCAGTVLSEAVRSVVDEGEGSPVNAPTSD